MGRQTDRARTLHAPHSVGVCKSMSTHKIVDNSAWCMIYLPLYSLRTPQGLWHPERIGTNTKVNIPQVFCPY